MCPRRDGLSPSPAQSFSQVDSDEHYYAWYTPPRDRRTITLPLEVWRQVFTFAQEARRWPFNRDPRPLNDVLLSAARVSKDLQGQAEAVLYRNATFTTCKGFTGFCRAVKTSRPRRLAVHSLTFSFQNGSKTVESAFKRTLPTLLNISELMLTSNVKGMVALIPDMNLHLRVLRLHDRDVGAGRMSDAVASLPSLQELDICDKFCFDSDVAVALAPANILPNLRILRLRHPSGPITLGLAASPLTHLCLGTAQPRVVADAVRLFGARLVSLRVARYAGLSDESIRALWPTSVMKMGRMPVLRRLELAEDGLPAVSIFLSDSEPTTLNSLVQWSGMTLHPEDMSFADMAAHCPVLDTVLWELVEENVPVVYKSTANLRGGPPEYATMLFAALSSLQRVILPKRPPAVPRKKELWETLVQDENEEFTAYSRTGGVSEEITANKYLRDREAWKRM